MKEKDIDTAWEQLSFEVAQQKARELAPLLDEILPGGAVEERIYGDLFPHELDGYQGPVRLSGYFPAAMSQQIKKRVAALLDQLSLDPLDVQFSALEHRNWAAAWQERYRPIPVGKRLVVVPTWLDNPYPDRLPIWMDPGMAFGSGTHPTTQLSLALLERCLEESQPGRMIDVGCGSGILSIGAAKLGVNQVLGVDIDPDAIEIASENAKTNRMSGSISFQEGSVKELLVQKGGSDGVLLVTANIIAPVLVDLFGEGLGDLVLPGGRLILSGILGEQLPEIQQNLDRTGFTLSVQLRQEDWIALAAVKD